MDSFRDLGVIPQAWEPHFRERDVRHQQHDTLACVGVALFLLIAALRVEGQQTAVETATHVVLMATVLAMLAGRGSEAYTTWRNVAVALVRVGLSASTVIHKHALKILQEEPATGLPWVRAPLGVLRMLVGDHTAMLAFMGAAWPVGGLFNVLLQLLCLGLVVARNEGLCATPYLQCATACALRDPIGGAATLCLHQSLRLLHLPMTNVVARPTEASICRWYTLAIQILLGFLTPTLLWACSDASAAVAFAAQQGIGSHDRTVRAHRSVHRYLCPRGGTLVWVVGAAAGVLAATVAALLLHRW